MMGLSSPANFECLEIQAEDGFSQKIEEVQIAELGGGGVCSVKFSGNRLEQLYVYGGWESNPWLRESTIRIPDGY